MNLQTYLTEKKSLIEEKLKAIIPSYEDIPVISEAVQYSLLAGGKRLRPILALMACELFDGDIEAALPFACSLEMIHTYSLIHDDLPSMDNDDYRRGRLTNHKVYGEAYAVLAGDALLNYAFETMLEVISSNPKAEFIRAAKTVSRASGVSGMIGGQCIDLYYENKKIDCNILENMHKKKTGAMITAALEVGAIIANAEESDINRIIDFGNCIGLAFQIADDILDVTGSTEKLGKKVGSDLNNNKSTFVTCFGLEESKKMAKELIIKAKTLIGEYGNKGMLLKELAEYIIDRDI